MNKQAIASLIIFLFLLLGTTMVILYARGYRVSFASGKPHIGTSGILVVTSNPDGAEVLINGRLTTATNNTINLTPDTYHVQIYKDGYFTWDKTMEIKQEVVSKADAYLFPMNPALQAITDLGAQNPIIDPTGTKIAYTIASQSAKKNGVYVLNMSGNLLQTLQNGSQQIADDTTDTFSTSLLTWSPDSKQLIASISASTTNATKPHYLLDATAMNNTPQDITETLFQTQDAWAKEKQTQDTAQINSLPTVLRTFAPEHMQILSWSPDETKLLYIASSAATLPPLITPALPDANIVGQERTLRPGMLYVLDVKEDKNFLISIDETAQQISADAPEWLSDNNHLVFVQNKKVQVIDADGSNRLTLYAGPFVDGFAYPWPTGSKIVILTNLGNPDITPNLYTLNLR